jgi:hypothetical protein
MKRLPLLEASLITLAISFQAYGIQPLQGRVQPVTVKQQAAIAMIHPE